MTSPSALFKKVTWVSIRSGFEVECGHCHEREEKPRLPMPLDSFHWWSVYILSRHEDCKPMELAS